MEQSGEPPLSERPEAVVAPTAQGSAPAAERFQPPGPRARALVFTFYAFLVVSLYTIVADVYGLRAVDAGLDGDPDADSMLDTSDTLDRISGVGYLLTGLALVIVFLLWFSRAYRNLPALGIAQPRRSHAWAIGSWFVPFANLVIPKLNMNDIWRSGEPDVPQDERVWLDRPVSALVHLWWAAWIVSSILGNLVARAWWDDAEELEDYRTVYALDLASACFDLVTALLAIAVVRRATRRQEQRAAQLGVG